MRRVAAVLLLVGTILGCGAITGLPPIDYEVGDGGPKCPPRLNSVIGLGACYGPGDISNYSSNKVCGQELHFAVTHEGGPNHDEAYPVTVDFRTVLRSGSVLVLSSVEAVDWTVRVSTTDVLAKIVVISKKTSTVKAPPGVIVDNRSPVTFTPCSPAVTTDDPCVAYVRAWTGADVGSMVGCDEAIHFSFVD